MPVGWTPSKHVARDKVTSMFKILDGVSLTTSQRALTAGQSHREWTRVPTSPHPCQHMSERVLSIFLSLEGVMYAVCNIFSCITLKCTHLDRETECLQILSHSSGESEIPRSRSHLSWVWRGKEKQLRADSKKADGWTALQVKKCCHKNIWSWQLPQN